MLLHVHCNNIIKLLLKKCNYLIRIISVPVINTLWPAVTVLQISSMVWLTAIMHKSANHQHHIHL